MEPTATQLPTPEIPTAAIALMGLGSLGGFCAIYILIQLFKREGAGLGILGLFCGPYTYIWGWMKAKQFNLSKAMMGWTIGLVLFLAGLGMMFASAAKFATSPEFQKAVKEHQEREAGKLPAPPAPAPVQ